tara:strand:+ start:128 stop:289 length:162 start_codon:yes stop_codon:yes gene_type:complete
LKKSGNFQKFANSGSHFCWQLTKINAFLALNFSVAQAIILAMDANKNGVVFLA